MNTTQPSSTHQRGKENWHSTSKRSLCCHLLLERPTNRYGSSSARIEVNVDYHRVAESLDYRLHNTEKGNKVRSRLCSMLTRLLNTASETQRPHDWRMNTCSRSTVISTWQFQCSIREWPESGATLWPEGWQDCYSIAQRTALTLNPNENANDRGSGHLRSSWGHYTLPGTHTLSNL